MLKELILSSKHKNNGEINEGQSRTVYSGIPDCFGCKAILRFSGADNDPISGEPRSTVVSSSVIRFDWATVNHKTPNTTVHHRWWLLSAFSLLTELLSGLG